VVEVTVSACCFGGSRVLLVARLPAVPDVPLLRSAEELAVLPHDVLAEPLADAYRVIAQMTAQAEEMAARVEEAIAESGRLAARVETLERRAGKDSSTSSKPPSDSRCRAACRAVFRGGP
jgi:hypothetical protein